MSELAWAVEGLADRRCLQGVVGLLTPVPAAAAAVATAAPSP